jgi:hypoxanthine phosphoribosyltransferase
MQETITKTVQLHDKRFSEYISAQEIDKTVARLAVKINADLAGKNALFICVLNGVFLFAADLLRKIETPCEVSFVKVSSYEGTASTGEVKTQIGLKEDIKGRTIVIVEDIIDTGNTVAKLLPILESQQPASIKIATLLFKPAAFKRDYKIDYTGMEIPNDFVVGYGLDYNGLGRNLPEIYKIVE